MAGEVETMQYIGQHPFPIASWPLSRSKSEKYNTDIRDIRQGGKAPDLAEAPRDSHRNANENTEIEHLQEHSAELATSIPASTILLELGAGCLRKTDLLLEAIEKQHKIIDYYAVDPDRDELERSLQELDPGRFKYIRCHGLVGTHEDARAWITKYENKQRPITVLSLGSTIGRMTRTKASDFWLEWSGALRKNGDKQDCHVIVGIHSCKDDDAEKDRLWQDSQLKELRQYVNVDGSYELHVLSLR